MRATIAGIACWLALSSAPAFAQHEGHMAHSAPKTEAAARVMSPQPRIGDIALVDHEGRATTLSRVLDTTKPVLVNFIFTSCTTICPVMSSGFAQLQANLGDARDSVQLVSISIDPETDTVDTLRGYAMKYHAGPSWRLLTGSRASVEAAQRAFGAFRGDKTNHAPVTYIRRSPSAEWESIDGLLSAETLQRAYRGDLAPSSF
jgi:protein SCO1/2